MFYIVRRVRRKSATDKSMSIICSNRRRGFIYDNETVEKLQLPDCLGERFKKFFRNPGSFASRYGRSTVHQKPRKISADFYNPEECLKPLKQPFLWDEIFTEFHFTFDDGDSRNAICLFHIRAVRREVKESSVRGDLKSAWFSSVYSKYLWGEKVWVTKAWARV